MFSWLRKKAAEKAAEVEIPVVREPSPCGNEEEHYLWTENEFMPLACPVCVAQMKEVENARLAKIAAAAALAEATAKAIEQEALAQRIAAIVIQHITNQTDWK